MNNRRLPILLIATGLWLPIAPASGQDATSAQRAEISRLVRERDQLDRRLSSLDAAAVARLKDSRPALEINAQQIATQDELDLVQLRLEILSTRYGLPVPPPPSEAPAAEVEAQADAGDVEAEQAFARGRQRTLTLVRREAERFARAIDFTGFLDGLPEPAEARQPPTPPTSPTAAGNPSES